MSSATKTATPYEEIPLYEKRREIYQREVDGPWQRMRAGVLFLLAGVYLAAPWFAWHGRQAIWWDLPERKFHIVGITFWPQDFILLSWLMILGAFGLFFFTNLAGRLWCGYGCPQTVWTKFFMWIEWLTEGDRNARMRLDSEPWSRRKLGLKAAKHAAWLALAVVVAVTFVGYFSPIRDLVPNLLAFRAGTTELVAVAFFTTALYADAGWMREQICKYACPYARFQGAMFDNNTLTIFYDSQRGEPRGHRGAKVDPRRNGLGDCVDCNLCVQVCPTGIDIRDGTQYDCIGCSACIDACDQVMAKVGYPKGLVRYATENTLRGGAYRLWRPRLLAYGGVFMAMAVAFSYTLLTRVPLEVDIIRERNRLYRETPQGDIENVYQLRVLNMDQRDHTYRIEVSGIDGVRVVGEPEVHVAAGAIADVALRLQAPADQVASGSTPVRFTVATSDDKRWRVVEESRFIAPQRR